MRLINTVWDFFRLWIQWGDPKEAWQDARTLNSREFQEEMQKIQDEWDRNQSELP